MGIASDFILLIIAGLAGGFLARAAHPEQVHRLTRLVSKARSTFYKADPWPAAAQRSPSE